MNLFMVDGIGPFFLNCRQRHVNWSKIPFRSLEVGDRLDDALFEEVYADFCTLVERTAALGFNAITLDDVAHLVALPGYPGPLRRLVLDYRAAFARLFDVARRHGMDVYLTTDVMFYPAAIDDHGPGGLAETCALLKHALHDVFTSFPQVKGVILRIGECDGVDVRDRFRSHLAIRRPAEARTLVRELLPVFEKHDRRMIFRTWSVGVHRIGDLIWNRNTFDRVFGGIDSPHLVISLKHGESDFFRYLPLNKLFFRGPHQKIIELQARREYEGSGEFPSFVGWDYEQVVRQLNGNTNVIGAWIWVQTGGWSCFRRRAYLGDGAIWNEINAFVTLSLVRNNVSTEAAVAVYCRTQLGRQDWEKLLVLLRLSDEVVKELLYVDQLARQKLFFRRLRVPPLLSVFWDQIIVNHAMRKLLRCLVEDPDEAVLRGRAALRKIRTMRGLAEALDLPVGDIDFMYDTFEILAASRDYYFGAFDREVRERLERLYDAYRQKHPVHYTVRLDFSPFSLPRHRIGWLLALWLRRRRGYRLIDRLLMIRLLSWMSPVFLIAHHKSNADLVENRAMGLDAVLR
jgi:hypothetical protein